MLNASWVETTPEVSSHGGKRIVGRPVSSFFFFFFQPGIQFLLFTGWLSTASILGVSSFFDKMRSFLKICPSCGTNSYSSSIKFSMCSRSRFHCVIPVAPEVIRGLGYSYSCDWWSLGVIMFECLYGCVLLQYVNHALMHAVPRFPPFVSNSVRPILFDIITMSSVALTKATCYSDT
jgi:serine/threonine protein kinase